MGAWLLGAPVGRAVALFGAEAGMARAALASADVPADRRLGLVFHLDRPSPAESVAADAADALSAAALAAYPHWFGSDRLAAIGTSYIETASLDAALRTAREAVPELSLHWARKAVQRAQSGRAPRDADTPPGIALRQLALALAGGALTLIPALPRLPDAAEAPATVLGLQWLARNSGAAVVVLLPGTRAEAAGRLDRLDLAELAPPDPPPGGDPPADRPWAGPIEGRPHWASPAENRLAEALAADAELGPLFAFNQPVPTLRGSRPRVDLLWRAGRLVVEIDGFRDHTSLDAFRRDRQRDYELAISGYLVLRLTAEEVLTDPLLSLDKLRDAVKFRKANELTGPD